MLSVLFLSTVNNVKSILVATSLAQNKLPVTQGLWEVTKLVVMIAEFPLRQHASWCVLEGQFPAVVYTYTTCFYYHIFAKECFKGWKDGSTVKSTGCSSQESQVQFPHSGSQPLETLVSGDLMSLPGFWEGTRHPCGTQTYMQSKHPHTQNHFRRVL